MAGLQTDDAVLAGMAESKRDEYEISKLRSHSSGDDDLDPNDGIHDGLTLATEEDKLTLRRVPDKVPWNAYLIAVVELSERFSYYGTTVVFTNFIQRSLPQGSTTGAVHNVNGQAGALGLGQRASTGLTTFNSFWVYVTPLIGAYIADTYWGRYKTICVSVAIALIGHVLLVISAVPSVIVHPNGSLAAFIIAIIVMGSGTGGFKSNISPLVAEQYRRTKLFTQTLKSGEKVVVDPTMTASRIYMYFYLFINIGALIGQIAMVYAEKFVGFWLAYLLPTLVFLLSPIILTIGRNRYVKSPPSGSVLSKALRLLRYASKGQISFNPFATFRNLTSPDFWERAKPSHVVASGEPKPRWMTFDDQWVDEVRRGFKACIVFVWYPIYWLTYNQLNNNLTSQAATMTTHGLPNDILSNLDPLALIILIPICDLFIYPGLRRMKIRFTPIKRITFGFFTGAAAMIWAAVVQHYIYKTNPCGNQASTCSNADSPTYSPLNVWIQSGSYILIAISEIFASITGLEYAFTKAPKSMRSLVMSVYLFQNALASAIGEAFVSVSADPLLVWNYGAMAVLAAIAGVGFWLSFRHLDAQEDELNMLAVGNVVTDDSAPTHEKVKEPMPLV